MLLKVPNVHFPIVLIHFQPLKREQPLYKGQQKTGLVDPTCPLFGGSTVHAIYMHHCSITAMNYSMQCTI